MLTQVSVSSIQAYQKCPLRWCFAWLDNRVPRREPTALTIGKAVHAAFEAHFTGQERVGQALASHLSAFTPDLLSDHERKAYDALSALVEPLDLWTEKFPIEATLEVETPFSIRMPTGQDFVGRPDRVVVCMGQTFHFQHKTLAASRDVGSYITAAQRSLHENIYAWALMRKYPERPYGGTIYNIIRKLKYRSTAKGKTDVILHTPDEMFVQTPIAINPARVEATYREIHVIVAKMVRTATEYARGTIVPSNREVDTDPYAGYLDPYFPVLMGEVSLSDDRYFMDRENPYDKENDDDAE